MEKILHSTSYHLFISAGIPSFCYWAEDHSGDWAPHHENHLQRDSDRRWRVNGDCYTNWGCAANLWHSCQKLQDHGGNGRHVPLQDVWNATSKGTEVFINFSKFTLLVEQSFTMTCHVLVDCLVQRWSADQGWWSLPDRGSSGRTGQSALAHRSTRGWGGLHGLFYKHERKCCQLWEALCGAIWSWTSEIPSAASSAEDQVRFHFPDW